uniref:Cytochrome c oxidase subunit 3 n=1 Tax=Crangonyx forbesi TaxID=111557 RepID=A0A6C0X7W3_9CRUS|nr:cytochrome c oxidase subunit III [Crangonyx forbesi]
MSNQHNHPFHLVQKSPWPLLTSLTVLFTATGLTKWLHYDTPSLMVLSSMMMALVTYQWWRDVVRESTMLGHHSLKVTTGLRWGMVLFIGSEVLFFFSFFWAFFHSSLNPTFEIGASWPPVSIYPFSPFQVPLLNTAILLTSGVSVTWAHHAFTEKTHKESILALMITITLGLYFTVIQAMEYSQAPFTLTDSVYGSTFFVMTGFHGFHVIVGTIFLMACLFRTVKAHFSMNHHFGLEAAIWYWHFVDVVWLFLFSSIYWWGSYKNN